MRGRARVPVIYDHLPKSRCVVRKGKD